MPGAGACVGEGGSAGGAAFPFGAEAAGGSAGDPGANGGGADGGVGGWGGGPAGRGTGLARVPRGSCVPSVFMNPCPLTSQVRSVQASI
ncbi:hypothetical protein GCM10011583_00550 [Streptomyces camponoticapitis]|uniref:Uncharacterized protein n=1 Tax=Streptomyces camponoticapitis TaxID=1616125 RepID=A0ABQ2DTS4_9ACTN|nr:hypothetical protein GCM10011583_00550 [Streptomyces camponoticapitis]